MCGIIGQFKKNTIDKNVFYQMRDTMFHRGPDGSGSVFFEDDKVALGHRRLSIIELSELGKQPMKSLCNRFWLTFNGEIYNYQILKKELEELGEEFISNSDSEVILVGFKVFGIQKLLSKLKGMFAFCIWDTINKKAYFARDRFGMKPFYYYKDDKQFVFASELKAIVKDTSIKRVIDNNAIADYFIYSYIPGENSIWENCKKLLPAHFAIYDYTSNKLQIEKYWELEVGDRIIDKEEAIEETKRLIVNSVKDHLVSDVPVGMFLSGGYDSTTVLKNVSDLGYKMNTFSLGFDDSNRSEHKVAKTIANHFSSNHFEHILDSNQDYFKDLKKLSYFYDEPFAISSMLPYYYVSKFTSESNKVALVGDGGDEAFGGYKWYNAIDKYFTNQSYKRKLHQFYIGKENKFLEIYNKSMTGILPREENLNFLNKSIVTNIEKRNLWYFKKHFIGCNDPVKSAQFIDVNSFISDHGLVRADRSSMANSIEVRVPFLDHEIYEFTFGLHSSVYFDKNRKKPLLEENLKGYIPEEVFKMPKYGFSFQHLNKLFGKEFESLILNGELLKLGIINKEINFKKLTNLTKFHLMMLEFWFQNYN